jgi:trk system potassium uptake protein
VNLRAVLWLLSRVTLLLAGFMLVPAAVAWYHHENDVAIDFLVSAGSVAALAFVLGWHNREATTTVEGRPNFFRREGLATVGLAWIVVCAVGSLPYLLTATIPSPTDAIFESVSGFTTTGASILTSEALDALPLGVTFWRSFTNWIGGIGIVLVFVVLFPTGGRSLFRSEVPGVEREAVQQRVRDSAIGLGKIYVGLTLLQIVTLVWAGVDVFDATLHAFATIATGGFSPHSQGVSYFGSSIVELLIALFMLASGVNFALYDTFLRHGFRRGIAAVARSTELKVYGGMIVTVTAVLTIALWFWGGSNGFDEVTLPERAGLPDYSSLRQCARDAFFTTVNVQSCTGFSQADYDRWPDGCRALLMFVLVVGACAFSRPRAVHAIRIDGETLDESTIASINGFFGMWAVVFIGGTLAMSALGLDIVSAFSAVLTTLHNAGPGLGTVGPMANYAHVPALGKVVLAILMILGRLEFYALVVLLVPRFWRS